MQIRKQLTKLSDAYASDRRLAVCPDEGLHLGQKNGCEPGKSHCFLGYTHSKYVRKRWKARARHHGNATGQSKGGQKG
jgi:hypothetical protein